VKDLALWGLVLAGVVAIVVVAWLAWWPLLQYAWKYWWG